MAGATPTLTSVKANVLDSDVAAGSDAATRPRPPARACPFTRAMTGTGLSIKQVRMSGMRLGAAAPCSLRSAPEQKHAARSREHDGPHVRVAGRVTNAWSSCSSRRAERALRLCGESSVTVRMPSLCCTPTNASVTGGQCRGVPAEGPKRAGGIVRR